MTQAAVRDKKADKRRHIWEAAVSVFARAGFHKARGADIAREADVADGTIYLYFKNKWLFLPGFVKKLRFESLPSPDLVSPALSNRCQSKFNQANPDQ